MARAAGTDELEIDIARDSSFDILTRAPKGRLAVASPLGCPSLALCSLGIRLCE